MLSRLRLKTIVALSAAGVVFAGSITARQFIAPANEPGIFSCVGLSIFGLSPCPYGLALFLLIAISAYLLLYRGQIWFILLKIFSVMGVAFSGWVVWRELCLPAIQLGASYWQTFSLARVPACAWGFLVFVAILVLTFSKAESAPRTEQ